MKDYELLDALGGIDPDYVKSAGLSSLRGRQRKLTGFLAAASVLILAIGTLYLLRNGWIAGRIGCGRGGNEGPVYMSYAGPVFPLSLMEADEDISAERAIHFDFSPYRSLTETYEDENGKTVSYETYRSQCMVKDSFSLTSHSSEDKTLTLLYPFAASLNSSADVRPVITVNGSPVETACFTGSASGALWNAAGSSSGDQPINLSDPASWEEYRDLTLSGFQASAFDSFPELDQPVTVYEIRNRYGKESKKAPAPYLNMEFRADFGNTSILTFGFNGSSYSEDTGDCSFGTFIPQEGNINYGRSAYLLVLGQDIGDYRLKAYTDGSCETEMENAGAQAVRYETDMDTVMVELSDLYLKEYAQTLYGSDENSLLAEISHEEFKCLVSEMLYEHGLLTENPGSLPSDWMLEDIFSGVQSTTRIMYLTFQAAVPAGSSVSVEAEMVKKASIDFTGSQKERNGYDMVTRLGSSLAFTGQTASLSGAEYIEILRQNFGFDPEKGIDEVTLDPNEPHYFIDVKKKDAE